MLLVYTCAIYSHVRGYAFCIFQEMNFACSNAVHFWKVQNKFLRPYMGKRERKWGRNDMKMQICSYSYVRGLLEIDVVNILPDEVLK